MVIRPAYPGMASLRKIMILTWPVTAIILSYLKVSNPGCRESGKVHSLAPTRAVASLTFSAISAGYGCGRKPCSYHTNIDQHYM